MYTCFNFTKSINESIEPIKLLILYSVASAILQILKRPKHEAVIWQKLISVEGNGHYCHRPSLNWEPIQKAQYFDV